MPESSRYTPPQSPTQIAELARRHGLSIDPESVRLNEAGLDYRVAYATTDQGEDWVLRVPRRAEMGQSITGEAAVLDLASAHLQVAVPQWQVANEELIAYPIVPGAPGLTLDDEGQPVFHVAVDSVTYARELGELVAALHAIPAHAAEAAGLQPTTVADIRAKLRADLDKVTASFTIGEDLLQRWHTWLATDSYWPTWTVFTHGELYQAHVLVDAEDRITGVLDWTTAAIGDPAVDLASQWMTAPAEVFQATVDAYVVGGGRTWPRLAEHCAELMAFFPVNYGLYALTTGSPEHTEAAQAQLTPAAQG